MLKFLGVILFFLLTTQAAIAGVTLKLAHVGEPDNPYGQGASYFAKLVAERSNGTINILIFPSSKLGNQRDLVEGLMLGTIDMTLTSSAVLGNFIPELSIFDLPYLFRDVQHAYKALDTIGMEICKQGEKHGMITLAIWEDGIHHITNNVRRIEKPADMKGLKFRVMEQHVWIQMMEALGASATTMPLGELHKALQEHVVDGQENTLAHIVTKGFYKIQKYLSLSAHAYTPEIFLISKKAWGELNKEQQQLVRLAALETRDWQRNLCRQKDKEFLEIIKATDNIKVNDNVDKAAFVEATKKVWDYHVKRFGDEKIKAILSIQ